MLVDLNEKGETADGLWRLVPKEPTPEMIRAALLAGYMSVGATRAEAAEIVSRKLATTPHEFSSAQYRAALAAAPPPPASTPEKVDGWMPINKAPRNGTRLRLYIPYDPDLYSVSQCVAEGAWSRMLQCWRFEGDDGSHDIQPTHWLPLLERPGASPTPDNSRDDDVDGARLSSLAPTACGGKEGE